MEIYVTTQRAPHSRYVVNGFDKVIHAYEQTQILLIEVQ